MIRLAEVFIHLYSNSQSLTFPKSRGIAVKSAAPVLGGFSRLCLLSSTSQIMLSQYIFPYCIISRRGNCRSELQIILNRTELSHYVSKNADTCTLNLMAISHTDTWGMCLARWLGVKWYGRCCKPMRLSNWDCILQWYKSLQSVEGNVSSDHSRANKTTISLIFPQWDLLVS